MSDPEVKAPARPDRARLSVAQREAAPQMQGESAPPRQAGGETGSPAATPLQIRDWAAF